MDDTNNPLTALIDDSASEIDQNKLVQLLKSYVVFSKEGEISFLKAFDSLNNYNKIRVILLTAKAKNLLNLSETDGLTPKAIIDLDVMPEGSVKSTLKKLLEVERDIKKGKNGNYVVPSYKLPDIEKNLSQGVK